MSTAFSLFADAASPVAPLVPNSLYHVGGKDVVGDQFSGLFVFLPNGTGAANDDTIPVTGGSSAVDIAGPVGYFCARSISS